MPEEREAKLDVPPGFEVPDLTGVLGGGSLGPPAEAMLDATYYDTHDLRLIRAGVTARHRTADSVGTWTVKFPSANGGRAGVAELRRDEIDVDGPPGEIPAAISALLGGHLRGEPLVPVAHLVTRRRRQMIFGPDGRTLGELDDDDVRVHHDDGAVVTAFREIEVEIPPGGDGDVLVAVVASLRGAGAGRADPTPKLVRALGERATAPPDLSPVRAGRRAPAVAVIRAALAASVARLVEQHRVVVLDEHPEGVHRARVACRRLRSDLRTFRPLLDQTWSEPMRVELRWLADLLGAVRDADVLGARLDALIGALPEDERQRAGAVMARLAGERAGAMARLRTALGSERYAALLDRLVTAVRHPPVRPEAEARGSRTLPGLAQTPWKQFRRARRRLGADPDPEALHRLRILAKRARYAAEAVAPVSGKAVRKRAGRLARLQDRLGEEHDRFVAGAWLRAAADGLEAAEAFVAGELAGGVRAWPS